MNTKTPGTPPPEGGEGDGLPVAPIVRCDMGESLWQAENAEISRVLDDDEDTDNEAAPARTRRETQTAATVSDDREVPKDISLDRSAPR